MLAMHTCQVPGKNLLQLLMLALALRHGPVMEAVQHDACRHADVKAGRSSAVLGNPDEPVAHVHLLLIHPLPLVPHHKGGVPLERLVLDVDRAVVDLDPDDADGPGRSPPPAIERMCATHSSIPSNLVIAMAPLRRWCPS